MQAAYATSIAVSFCGESAGATGLCGRGADVLAADVVVARLATEGDPEAPPQPAAARASRSAAPNTTRPANPFAAALTERMVGSDGDGSETEPIEGRGHLAVAAVGALTHRLMQGHQRG